MECDMLSPIEALTRNFILPNQPSDHSAKKTEFVLENFHGLIVGNLALLLASDKLVIEIVDSLPLCRLPNAPLWLHAMANQRGNIIPIFDLAILLEQSRGVSKQTRYLIIAQERDQFGIVIDNLPERIEVKSHDFIDRKPTMPSNLEPFVDRVCEREGRMWLEWDPLGFVESSANYG